MRFSEDSPRQATLSQSSLNFKTVVNFNGCGATSEYTCENSIPPAALGSTALNNPKGVGNMSFDNSMENDPRLEHSEEFGGVSLDGPGSWFQLSTLPSDTMSLTELPDGPSQHPSVESDQEDMARDLLNSCYDLQDPPNMSLRSTLLWPAVTLNIPPGISRATGDFEERRDSGYMSDNQYGISMHRTTTTVWTKSSPANMSSVSMPVEPQFTGEKNPQRHLLYAHVTKHYQVERSSPFACIECGKILSNRSALQEHANSEQHSPFLCICGIRFARVDVLHQHIDAFADAPNFPCNLCKFHQGKYGFRRRDHLTQHLRGYHKLCSEEIDSVCTPIRPTSNRTIYICPHSKCDFSRNNSSQAVSQREQLDQRPFSKQADLTKHLREVHGETPFPCDISDCDRIGAQGYVGEEDFIKHKSAKHPEADRYVAEKRPHMPPNIHVCKSPSQEQRHTITGIARGENERHSLLSPVDVLNPLQAAERNTEVWVDELKVLGALKKGSQLITGLFEGSLDDSPTSYGVSSSPGEHSIVTDSDLLSISDTSEPGLFFDIGPLSPLQNHMLDHILRDYRTTKQYQNGGDAHVTPAASTSSLSTYSTSQTGSGKKKSSNRDSPTGTDNSSSLKASKRAREDGIRPKVLACPYWKHTSEKHRLCCKLSLKRIRDVKQHLHRRHTPKLYCNRCLEIFEDTERYDVHSQSTEPCFRVPGSRLEGITRVQSIALSKKSDRTLEEEDQWFAMWDILFPSTPRPASAYVDSGLAEEMNSFQEYWTNRGHDVLINELNSSDVWSLSPEEREVQGRQILARGLNLIYEQWAGLRRNASTTPPHLGILPSPHLSNTTTASLQSSTVANPSSSITYTDHATQTIMTLSDQATVDSTVAGNDQVGVSRPQCNSSHSGSHTPPTSTAIETQPLQSEETSERDAFLVGAQVELGEFDFMDMFGHRATSDIESDFNAADGMEAYD